MRDLGDISQSQALPNEYFIALFQNYSNSKATWDETPGQILHFFILSKVRKGMCEISESVFTARQQSVLLAMQTTVVHCVQDNKMLSYRRQTALQGALVLAKLGRLNWETILRIL